MCVFFALFKEHVNKALLFLGLVMRFPDDLLCFFDRHTRFAGTPVTTATDTVTELFFRLTAQTLLLPVLSVMLKALLCKRCKDCPSRDEQEENDSQNDHNNDRRNLAHKRAEQTAQYRTE